MRGVDLREHGSKNTGGTNAVRVLGPKYGIPVMVLDVLKGVAAVWLASQVGGVGLEVIAATAVLLGHTFPVFLGFGGGKGVATGAGTTLALAPPVGFLIVPIWIIVVFATGYVSVGSLVAAVAIPTMSIAFGEPWQVSAFFIAGGLLVIYRHRVEHPAATSRHREPHRRARLVGPPRRQSPRVNKRCLAPLFTSSSRARRGRWCDRRPRDCPRGRLAALTRCRGARPGRRGCGSSRS